MVTAADVLDRFTVHDVPIETYSVPVHVDVRVRKLISMRFSMNGMAYYKRPGRVALEMRSAPANFRRLFGEMGTPLTWHDTYDMQLVDVTRSAGHTIYSMSGVPKRPGDVKRFALHVDSDPTAPLHGEWECNDGTMIAMSMIEQAEGPYQLPKRAEVDLNVSGFRIHAVLDYGDYALNVAVADTLFST